MNISIKKIAAGIGIMLLSLITYLILSAEIEDLVYGYKLTDYTDEIDFLFKDSPSYNLQIENYYSSRKGRVYHLKSDTTIRAVVVETESFPYILPMHISLKMIDKIESNDFKTYNKIIYKNYPLLMAMVHPRHESELSIYIQKPLKNRKEIVSSEYYYFNGDCQHVAIGNKRFILILTFRNNMNNEILILKKGMKKYFILQSNYGKSVLDYIDLTHDN